MDSKRRRKTIWWTAGTLAAVVVLALAAMTLGRYEITLPQFFAALFPGAFPDIEVSVPS